MHRITDNIIIMHMTTTVNNEEIELNPPSLPFLVDDEKYRKELLANAKHGASQYDMYKNIVQLSLMDVNPFKVSPTTYTHLLYCPTAVKSVSSDVEGKRSIVIYNDQSDLAAGINLALTSIAGNSTNGNLPVGMMPVIAGWKINTDIWPTLINFMFAHKLDIPAWWKTDPTAKWGTVKGLLDVSTIYSQGVSMNMRRLPALNDALRYWGEGDEYDSPIDIIKATCDDPKSVATKIEAYLTGMYNVIKRYYVEDK